MPLMIPLIAFTGLFNSYICQQHFRAAEHLPARTCTKVDRRNGSHFDLSFVQNAYIQPELKVKEAFPAFGGDVSDLLSRQGHSEGSGSESEGKIMEFVDSVDPGTVLMIPTEPAAAATTTRSRRSSRSVRSGTSSYYSARDNADHLKEENSTWWSDNL